MKTIIKTSVLAGLLAVGAVSCGENSWNDQLEGFNPNPGYTQVKSMDYTLTAADYKTLADNSTNKALAIGDTVSALKSVGTLAYFNQMVSPDKYVPALLRDEKFSYFGLTEGSAINITYRIAKNLPENMIQLNAASEYIVSVEDYQKAYGSDENFAETFCPKFSATANLPKILKTAYPEAVSGQYAVIGYNNSTLDPSFGEGPKFQLTSVLGAPVLGATVDVKGQVTAICSRGFVLTDKGGSILVYIASGFDQTAWKIGDNISLQGVISAYGKGFQIDGAAATTTIVNEGAGKYTYPAPTVYTGAMMDEAVKATDNFGAKYCEFTGTVVTSQNAAGTVTYYNINVEGATTSQGSVYQISDEMKKVLVDGGTYTFCGYFSSISSGKFFNVILTSATAPKSNKPARVTRAGSQVPTTFTYSVYKYDGSKWAVASDVVILQPEDYAAMGSKSDLSGDKPATCIPAFMAKNFPYGAKDQVKYVMYKYYANKVTSLRCEEYTNNGTDWVNTISNGGVITETKQFVYKPQGWVMDPSVVLTLPAVKGDATSSKFYQSCVDWVKNNVEGGAAYISSYGNNDYYTGASAYQCNVDLRASAAKTQNPTAYAEMSDDEVVALEKKRFETEVVPGVLSLWYPNMDVVSGLDVTVTINFSVYTGATTEHTIVFKVVGKGKFEFVSCTWNN